MHYQVRTFSPEESRGTSQRGKVELISGFPPLVFYKQAAPQWMCTHRTLLSVLIGAMAMVWCLMALVMGPTAPPKHPDLGTKGHMDTFRAVY